VQDQAEVADRDKRARVSVAESLTLYLHRLAQQRLSGGEVTFVLQQQAKVVDGGERARMPMPERLALHVHRLAVQRLSGG